MIKWVPKIKLLVIILQLSCATEIWHKLCPTREAGAQCHTSGKSDCTGLADMLWGPRGKRVALSLGIWEGPPHELIKDSFLLSWSFTCSLT